MVAALVAAVDDEVNFAAAADDAQSVAAAAAVAVASC